jgi:L-2-hydroxyglutarate oxidase
VPASNTESRTTSRSADVRDLVVVGAGLLGLATARAFLRRAPGARVTVLDKETELARHQSGRNSGVVHAGLYYPAGSLKAQLCREGRFALFELADAHGIPYAVTGKVVVALDEQEIPRLDELERRGAANGLRGMRRLTPPEVRELEPHVQCLEALHVPETAVIDFRAVTRAYASEVEGLGAEVLLGRQVVAIEKRGRLSVLRTRSDEWFQARRVVACAGLQSDRIARLTGTSLRQHRIAPFRGDFYVLAPEAAALVRGLVYPVPNPSFPFLGVHFTRRIDGEVWAGPNAVPAFAREGYGRRSVNRRDAWDLLAFPGLWRLAWRYAATGAGEIWRDTVKRAAVREMRRYVPELEAHQVTFGPAGVRAQALARDGTLVDDFLLDGDGTLLHVLNAPSPGATASLAIGERIAAQLSESRP